MKIKKLVHDNVSTKKKCKRKKKQKEKVKLNILTVMNQVGDLPKSTSSFCSFDNVSAITENDSQIILTPSKSESEYRNQTIPEFEENDQSFASVEESFNYSIEENDSYTYNSVADELIGSEVQNGEARIISQPEKKVVPVTKESFSELEELTENKVETINDHNIEANSDLNVQYFHSEDGIVVILKRDASLYFHGLMSISVLHGEIEVLGYKVTKNCQDVKLYSLRSASLLYLKNVTKSDIPVTRYLMPQKLLDQVKLSENCAIIICKTLLDPSISFIEKHVAQQILPKHEETQSPRVVFQPKGNWNLYKPNEQWDSVINTIHKYTKMMICGGKGVGKSTFLRYTINRLLMKFREIQVIDLDPGQPEFTIPGIISIVRINEPLFGPNYTHLKTPERSILSNINIAYEPEKYIESVKCLLENCKNDTPTLINFMGFTHGIGINILSAAIIHVQPSDLIQIRSENNKKNYKDLITPNVVFENAKLFLKPFGVQLNYKLHLINSMCDENDGWTAEPRQLREMNILSYFSNMADSNSLFKSKAPVYRVNLEQIKIIDVSGKTIPLAAVNANLVALCSLVEKSPNIFECHGWGIVRGADMVTNDLVLLTLEELSVLEKVDYLVLNSARLPPSLFMTPDDVVGQVPYVMEGTLMFFGQIPKRSRLSIKSKE